MARPLVWFTTTVATVSMIAGCTALTVQIATFPETISDGDFDVAIVLGSVVEKGRPTPVFAGRIDHAVDLFQRGVVHHIILTGGNEPPKALYDSEVARNYAAERGVPPHAMEVDIRSRTTRENLIEAQRIAGARGWTRCLVVSDPYHLYRASRHARALGLDAAYSATPTSPYRSLPRKLPFLAREVGAVVYYSLRGM